MCVNATGFDRIDSLGIRRIRYVVVESVTHGVVLPVLDYRWRFSGHSTADGK